MPIQHLLAIDPGFHQSACVQYNTATEQIENHVFLPNEEMRAFLESEAQTSDTGDCGLVVEMFEARGMPIGQESVETVFWAGRFLEIWAQHCFPVFKMPRRDIKIHLFGTTRGVNDAVIRQFLIDRYGPEKQVALGTKKNPGPLYGLNGHERDALALAIAWWETTGKDVS